MVIIRLQGGLGNQLFQYALYLQLKAMGRSVKMDEILGFEGDLQRTPCLARTLGICYETATDREVRTLRDAFMDPVSRIRRKLTGRRNLEWEEPDAAFHPEVLAMEEAYLNGYFQSDRYFGDPSVRETLGEIFAENIRRRMSGGGPAGFAAAAERIMADGEHAVSLHIRRGDYLLAEPAKTHGGICTEHYYGEAVTLVRGSVPDAVFYVFSDDAAYAAQFAQEGEAAGRGRFVPVCSLLSEETGGPAEIDAASLLLMRLCRHHILANSSFSWWGAWSARAEEETGIVIAPDRWFNNRPGDAVYTDRMRKLHVS